MIIGTFSRSKLPKSEIFMTYLPTDWYIDTGTNVHVCSNISSFISYQNLQGRTVTMGNSTVAQVLGQGRVDLRFTSENVLTLNDVQHIPEVRKNLVSGVLLNKEGFKLVFECNNVSGVHKMFVGIEYVHDDLLYYF